MKENILEILKEWNIENAELKQIYDSAWQVGEKYVLKVYDNSERIRSELKRL